MIAGIKSINTRIIRPYQANIETLHSLIAEQFQSLIKSMTTSIMESIFQEVSTTATSYPLDSIDLSSYGSLYSEILSFGHSNSATIANVSDSIVYSALNALNSAYIESVHRNCLATLQQALKEETWKKETPTLEVCQAISFITGSPRSTGDMLTIHGEQFGTVHALHVAIKVALTYDSR